MTIQHNVITDPDIHEPKGVASASTGQIYVANGAGSGTWQDKDKWLGVYTGFDAAGPAYQHSTTTSDTVLNNTWTTSSNDGFTVLTSPNTRLRYDGTETITTFIQASFATKQASGANKDVEWVLYKNGVAVVGSRVIRTLSTGTWGSISFSPVISLATNDYIELFTKADGACTVDYASIQLMIQGHS